jgi:hypothetical protein
MERMAWQTIRMESLDTGRYSLSIAGKGYVHVVIYTDQELTSSEVPTILEYFRQFNGPVPVLVDRKGRYSLSTGAQLAFIKHARRLFRAVAFLDTAPLQRRLSQIAGITYFRNLPVKSFAALSAAELWLTGFGPFPAFTDLESQQYPPAKGGLYPKKR